MRRYEEKLQAAREGPSEREGRGRVKELEAQLDEVRSFYSKKARALSKSKRLEWFRLPCHGFGSFQILHPCTQLNSEQCSNGACYL